MAVLLVTYDLKKPGQDYSDLLNAIKGYAWAKLSESSYAIITDNSPSTIYSELRTFIDVNDHIYIINLKRPHYGYGPKDVNDWLGLNLPN
jgi:hypothetical protein